MNMGSRAWLLTVAVLAIWTVQAACASAGDAGRRVTIGHTSASLMLPDDFVPVEMEAHVEGVMSKAMWASIAGQQMPDVAYVPSVTDSRFFRFLSTARATGFWPPDVRYEDIKVGDRKFVLVTYDRKIATVTEHFWQLTTGPAPSLTLLFTQFAWPDKPTLLNRAKVLALLETLEIGLPLSFEDLLPETGLTVTPRAPFGLHVVMANQVMLSTTNGLSPVPGSAMIMLGYQDRDDPRTPLIEIADAFHHNPIEIDQTLPVSFMDSAGIRRMGREVRAGLKPDSFVEYVSVAGGRVVMLFAMRSGEDFTPEQLEAVDAIAKSARRTSPLGERQ